MIKKIVLLGMILAFSNCAKTSIYSNANNVPKSKKYNDFLVVALNPKGGMVKNGIERLSNYLAENIRKEGKKSRGVVVDKVHTSGRKKLALNRKSDGAQTSAKIYQELKKGKHDLLLVLDPVRFTYYNNSISFITYDVTATDTRTKKEIWRAEFITKAGLITPSKKNAKIAYEALKKDGLLK